MTVVSTQMDPGNSGMVKHSTASERCVSNDFFRRLLEDNQISNFDTGVTRDLNQGLSSLSPE